MSDDIKSVDEIRRDILLRAEAVRSAKAKRQRGIVSDSEAEFRRLKEAFSFAAHCSGDASFDEDERELESMFSDAFRANNYSVDSLSESSGHVKPTEARERLGDWLVDSFKPEELTNVELQRRANDQIAAEGWPLLPYDSEDGSGVWELYKRAWKRRYNEPLKLDRRGRRRAANRK
jgi:hypothetical protein